MRRVSIIELDLQGSTSRAWHLGDDGEALEVALPPGLRLSEQEAAQVAEAVAGALEGNETAADLADIAGLVSDIAGLRLGGFFLPKGFS